MKRYTTRFLPIYIALAVVLGMFVGNFYANHFAGRRINLINTSSNKLSDLLHIIDDQYVDTVNMSNLVEKALPLILRELDPHSTYVSAADVENEMQSLKGSFSGIGVQFYILDDTVRIVKVIDGGPSERVGLQQGDCIVAVNGKNFTGKDVNEEETRKRLKGPADSEVSLKIVRHGQTTPLEFVIRRGSVPIKSVDASYMANDRVGYLRINTWGDATYAEFISAMAQLSASQPEGIVVDLRGNLGGYLEAAVKVANEFLPGNRLIVYTEGRRFPREDYTSDGRGSFQRMPLVVLVDETSASASEIFAGAMQDNDRATIVGRRTFGKGLVQVPIQFRDGSMIRLTRARYYTPSGRCVQQPYTPGGEDEYESDRIKRAEDGEYFNPDSIKTSGEKYHTRIGRTVYGGGGIIPDIFVSRDTTGYTSYFKQVVMSDLVTDFAYRFVDARRKTFSSLSDAKAIVAYLTRRNIVELFVQYAEKNGVKRRNLMIRTSHSLLFNHLAGNIISDVLEMKDVVEFNNTTDPAVKEACRIIEENRAFPEKK